MCFKHKFGKQTDVLETPQKCGISPPRRQYDYVIKLRKADVTSGWRFLGRRPGLLKVAIRAPSNEAMELWAPRKNI